MKYTKVVNPSSTPQTITVDVPDPVITATGETPIDPVPPVNHTPTVSVASVSIKLPQNSAALTAKAGDTDGTIAGYVWELLNGGGKLDAFDRATVNVSGLTVPGITNLRVTVYDDKGASATAYASVTIQPADVVTPPGDYGTLIYKTGYDKLSDIINNSNQQGNGGLSTTVFKTPPGSFHSVPANVSSGIRSEVQYPSSLTPSEGVMVWDVMYAKVQQDNIHSFQFHPNTSGGSASPGLWHIGGKFVWVNWKGGTNTKYPTGVTIPTNVWMHMVFEYKMGSSGYMKFSIDGKVVLDVKNIQVGDGSGAYAKVGTNSWNGTGSEAYYDNLEIWKK